MTDEFDTAGPGASILPEQAGSPWAVKLSRPLLNEIERRWNSHDALVDALQNLCDNVSGLVPNWRLEEARAAIALAREQTQEKAAPHARND